MCEVLCVLEEWDLPWLEEDSRRRLLLVCKEAPFFLLTHPQIHFLAESASDEEIEKKCWELLFLPFSYRGEAAFFARIEACRQKVHLFASDFRDMGKRVLSNYLANFEKLAFAKRGSALRGKFEGIPALILGAGPSLEQEIEELRAWENRALLFAGGAALNVLSTFSLQPHFSAAVDPGPLHPRFEEQTLFEVPCFYQSRVAKELLASLHAPLLWMPDSGGYPLDQWMHEQAGILEPPFEAGWNVATFCAAIARSLGCHPIIFVGLELSTPTQNVYAKGADETVGKEFIEAKDVEGKKVYTKQDWVMAGRFLEEFGGPFLNVTRGGLPLAGIPRLSLAEARKKYGKKMHDMRALVHGALAPLDPCASPEEVERVSRMLQESFTRCEEHCHALFSLYEKHPSSHGKIALHEVELEEEVACNYFLTPLWNIWGPLFLRENKGMHQDLHKLCFFKRILHERTLRDERGSLLYRG